MTVRHVPQVDANGCGVACLAMVTGKSYEEVRDWFWCKAWQNAQRDGRTWADLDDPERQAWERHNFAVHGLTDHDLEAFLAENGFAYAKKWSNLWQQRMEDRRPSWPPLPFAEAHIVQVYLPSGGHYVVWTADGRVLDPANGECDLTGFSSVGYILGVSRLGRLS